ncbi:MAG TPA: DNA cytosine methyltransferase [Pirellulales bacterium]|nr:DNA cytosine methyltransferase [Pirellulales bacterium]
MKSIELFTGAGGLALGTALAGFEHEAVLERDHDSCETLRLNKSRRIPHVRDWSICETDVRLFDYSDFGHVDLVAGGVPCQPFSLGGKHGGHKDERDMFPELTRAVQALRPLAFIVENVKGLLRGSFAEYFEYVILRLSHPGAKRRGDWREHRAALERIHTASRSTGLDYNVVFQLLNAADYGVPQRRERVFIVGFRSDLGVSWSFPSPTHSRESLLRSQWMTGEYWERHGLRESKRPPPENRAAQWIERNQLGLDDGLKPWRTVRDALDGLITPRTTANDLDHFLNPGARAYTGHTGSPWDEPAKVLKAGDHGVPGGENTLAIGDGTVRYFSVREAARLQSFPDEYLFAGSWTERMRQIGNAVPVDLARAVAESVAETITTF